jgi:hypothetical protein
MFLVICTENLIVIWPAALDKNFTNLSAFLKFSYFPQVFGDDDNKEIRQLDRMKNELVATVFY